MSGTLQIQMQARRTVGGVETLFPEGPAVHNLFPEVTIDADNFIDRDVTVQPDQIVVLWEWYGSYPDFAAFLAYVDSDGETDVLMISRLIDKPLNGTTDTTASGTAERWEHQAIGPEVPITNRADTYGHTTLATATGSYTDADLGKLPLLYQDANRVQCNVYKIVAWNPGSTAIRLRSRAWR